MKNLRRKTSRFLMQTVVSKQPNKDIGRRSIVFDFDNDPGVVQMRMNVTLHNVATIWIQSIFVDTPSNRVFRIESVQNNGLEMVPTAYVCSAGAAVSSKHAPAFYFDTGAATGTRELGTERLFMHAETPTTVRDMAFNVTDENGNPVTYNRLIMFGEYEYRDPHYQKPTPVFRDPTSKQMQDAWDEGGYSRT